MFVDRWCDRMCNHRREGDSMEVERERGGGGRNEGKHGMEVWVIVKLSWQKPEVNCSMLAVNVKRVGSAKEGLAREG